MNDYIPAPVMGSTETAAPQVTGQTSESVAEPNPQAETPAGTAGDKPAGQEQTASAEPPSPDDAKQTWKEKRQERNRARWQEYKAAKEGMNGRLQALEAEVNRLRGGKQPDFSQFVDPQEELAQRTAWTVRQQQANDAQDRLESERQIADRQTTEALSRAWDEAVEDARGRIPDFETVALAPTTPVHEKAVPFLVESDKGADILYYLGKNPSEARALFDKFAAGSPQALIELGRIEAKLSAPPPASVTRAPAPAPILNGGQNPLQFDAARASVDDMAAYLKKAGVIA